METVSSLWSDYGWILPLALLVFCVLGCAFGRRKGVTCCCGWRRNEEQEVSR